MTTFTGPSLDPATGRLREKHVPTYLTKAAQDATYLLGDKTGATDGQVATWDAASGKFKPKAPAAIGGNADLDHYPPLTNIQKAATGPFRVFLTGTSISSFDNATVRVLVEQLKSVYGHSGIFSQNLGFAGGGWANTWNGWKKQVYGGPQFTRLRGDNTASPFSFTGSGDEVVLEWSRETDSAPVPVMVDGIQVGTVGSAGSQVYNQRAKFTLTLPAPVLTLGATAGSGGTFAPGTYFWVVTYVNPAGETIASNEVTATLAANGTQALSWTLPDGASNVKIYQGITAGSENALVATLGRVTSYTVTGAAGVAATPPVANTARDDRAHIVTVSAPASGAAYLERFEIRSTVRTGVEVYDATLGGSSMWNMTTNNTTQAGQVASIPIVGTNGLAAHFARTDVDLFIVEHLFNDTGVEGDTAFEANVNYAVTTTQANGKPIVFIIEPCGGQNLSAGYIARRDVLLKQRQYSHVTVIDWQSALWQGDFKLFLQRYYNITTTAESPFTYTGDASHPKQNGYDPLNAIAAKAFNVPAFPQVLASSYSSDRMRDLSKIYKGASRAATVNGVAKTYPMPEGPALIIKAPANGAVQGVNDFYYRDTLTVDKATSLKTAIAASTTSTKFGKYLDYNNQIHLVNYVTAADTDIWTVTVKASGNFGAIFGNPLYIIDPNGLKMPQNEPSNSRMNFLHTVSGVEPVTFMFRFAATSTASANAFFSGRIYDLSITRSTVPVLGT
ncbi:hypothetical protein [Arthrobacter sp. MA-N2]|uniref:hypothetical protein n=1 Tax=Arthrobacter sp. MA-N2 TaxID=1101188 RepID=UPI00048862A9|nr:hypothetical protein [Arthrobacter sp. MA-N2]